MNGTTDRLVHAALGVLRKYSAVLLLVVGVVMLYLFVSIRYWAVVGPILGVVIGSFVAVVGIIIGYFRDAEESTETEESEPLDPRVPWILAGLYVVSMVVLFRFNTYYRPDLMYVLFGGYAGLIGYQIARGESRVRIIPQIFVLAFFTYWSSQFLFPAGMFGPDTYNGYLPAIRTSFSTFQIPSGLARYAGHLAYVIEFSHLSGLSAETAYYLLATLVLVGTVLLLGMLDRIFPAIPERVALYSALVFSVMSWMIGRGMHPNKLNFFYPVILLLGFAAVKLYQAGATQDGVRQAWLLVGVVLCPALIFGHRFSAGAGLVFLFVVALFSVLCQTVLEIEYERVPIGSPVAFVSIYVIGLLGNPLHQEPLLGRLSGLVLSVLVSTGATEPSESASVAGGGPGRYSALPFDVLIVSTAAQLVLFTFTILGAIWVFRRRDWEYDYVLVWMVTISVFLVVTILTNSVDTAPQRFYAMLGLFGFNVCAGVFFNVLRRRSSLVFNLDVHIGRTVVVFLICCLAVTSLASPIADNVTSPVADEIPDNRQFDTYQLTEGQDWIETYPSKPVYSIVSEVSDVPIEQTGRVQAKANMSAINRSSMYSYSALTNRTGVITSGGLSLGGRNFAFVAPPNNETDDKLYANGETTVYKRK